MEGIGVAFGAVGALSQVLECFKYVYVARSFGADYQLYQLKLENSRLRLSRWGAAVKWDSVSEEEGKHVVDILQTIRKLFKKAEDYSVEFAQKNPTQRDTDDQQGMSEMNGVDRITAALHEKMSKLSLKREIQPSKSPLKQFKWAIYSKEHMASLTGELTTLTTDLVELFPTAKAEQKKYGEIEMLDFLESIRILQEAISDQDNFLTEQVNKVLEPAEQHIKFQNNLRDRSVVGNIIDANSGKIEQKFG